MVPVSPWMARTGYRYLLFFPFRSLSLSRLGGAHCRLHSWPTHLQVIAHLIIPASPSYHLRGWLSVSRRWSIKRLSLALTVCKIVSSVSFAAFLVLILSSVFIPRFLGSVRVSHSLITRAWVWVTSGASSKEECVVWLGRREVCITFNIPCLALDHPHPLFTSPHYLYIVTQCVVNTSFAPFSLSVLKSVQSTVTLYLQSLVQLKEDLLKILITL